MEEKLKRQQTESGSDELICPFSLPSQHKKWKLTKTKVVGQMISDKSLELSQRIINS